MLNAPFFMSKHPFYNHFYEKAVMFLKLARLVIELSS
jgi:hypothetical protein